MARLAAAGALASLLAACATAPQLHHVSQLQPGTAYFCMAPDGTLAREIFDDRGGVTCPAPARFISQPYCASVPAPPRDELAYYRARARAAADGSLVGDSFDGQPFCVMPKLGPPPPS